MGITFNNMADIITNERERGHARSVIYFCLLLGTTLDNIANIITKVCERERARTIRSNTFLLCEKASLFNDIANVITKERER